MDHTELQKNHRYFAADAFNACWQLIDLPERTETEGHEMVRCAETSFWHWMQVDNRTKENESIGLWQLARVYSLVGKAETSHTYARSCLETARSNDLGPFHESYALEAIARAFQVEGKHQECQSTLDEAWALTPQITDSKSRDLVESDLRTITTSPN